MEEDIVLPDPVSHTAAEISLVAAVEPAAPPMSALRAQWWRLLDRRVGVVPLPVYLALLPIVVGFAILGKVPSDLTMAIGVLSLGGFFFMELGRRVPMLSLMGGAAILAFVVPSAMTHYGLIPPSLVLPIKEFVKASNFLYLYVAAIIVGSIVSMEREVLLGGFLKIFVPLTVSSVVAGAVGTLTGMTMGLDAYRAFFFVVVPIMAGGLGEGAIPLSMGYALITGQQQPDLFAQIIPVVMLGSFTAVLLCGLLNVLGKRFPQLTGEGVLQRGSQTTACEKAASATSPTAPVFDPAGLAGAMVTIVAFYLVGVLVQRVLEFPAPITMLFLIVAAKLGRAISPALEQGGKGVYQFFSGIVTWPLLFALGVALTPWREFVSAFTVPTVVTVFATVGSMIASGFFVARFVNMYPIDVAVVTGCHSGQGGAGDIAILTAANRMQLMPFAQIATRIGGAITVTLALIAIRHVH
ncbi:2-hydroxycarboxylate transporter family protein [Cupriavidus sp. SS-3]|uniref:2-hydroxycarboxylate transporter family protein n=1 Tax=Cupriavidus sp. SS-3 TaxID=3109596 RepID=UPI002DBC733F|nr:2-hydroxycarboxylate transporter family protein [Cupriavidus sp. SS-3]MEC3767261.1 2-hydroxycarboxylate transporter family protein [Cupriavidus sp. SS-3]